MPKSEPVRHMEGVGERLYRAIRQARTNQLALARKAGISRQTLTTVLSTDHVSRPVGERIATALGIPGHELFPGLIPEHHGGRHRSPDPAAIERPLPRVLGTHRVRVWLASFRHELTKAGASDDQIREAVDLVTAPQIFSYYRGGSPGELNENEAIIAMEAIATGIRKLRSKRHASR
jgi:lambda repressor-like predicted transcriptional regulator